MTTRTLKDVLVGLEALTGELRGMLYGVEVAASTAALPLPSDAVAKKLRAAAAMARGEDRPATKRPAKKRSRDVNDERMRSAVTALKARGLTTVEPGDIAREIGVTTTSAAFIYDRLRERPGDFGLAPASSSRPGKKTFAYRIGG